MKKLKLAMSVRPGRKISIIEHPHEIIFVNPVREAGLNNDDVYSSNRGACGNNEQLQNILNAYPEILETLRSNH